MSGAYAINRPRILDYELIEAEEQRRQRARLLRMVYALADPHGWDARRSPGDRMLGALGRRARDA